MSVAVARGDMPLRRALSLAAVLVVPLLLLVAGAAGGQDDDEADANAAPTTASAHASGNPHGALTVGCEQCHTAEGWRPLRQPLPFHHDRETGFPLVASHRTVSCVGCHQDLRFTHVASACADCHTDVHRGTMGFDCQSCHSEKGWSDQQAVLALHAAALLPLTGAHATLECEACHRGGPAFELRAVPVECVGCHREDYLRAQPNHLQLGFPLDCQQCHDTVDFANADFRDHDRLFPIHTGRHARVWDSCSDCHPSGIVSFTCLTCHEHSRGEMDDEHDDVRGYRYESRACLSCHPRGTE
jgi:hypothetical protein